MKWPYYRSGHNAKRALSVQTTNYKLNTVVKILRIMLQVKCSQAIQQSPLSPMNKAKKQSEFRLKLG